MAARAGLVGVSLTDHDTVHGIEEAATEAARLGLQFLPGAELSANQPGRSVHLLAYGFDLDDPGMRLFFDEFWSDRIRRTEEIVDRLNRLDVGLSVQDVLRQSGNGVPTRAHIGRALVAAGWVGEIETAFDRWIARGRPAFVEKKPTPPEEVVDLVHAAGGVVLLAHPGRDFAAAEIRGLAEVGLDGVEILHPRNGYHERKMLGRLADELDLLRGGGSDWHGPDSARSGPGTQQVPLEWLHAIASRCVRGNR